MSRRHRRSRRGAGGAGADSLDLLLGPMCNTFGGIVLTAVVLALLSREVDNKADQQARVSAAADTTEMLERRLAKAGEDLATAQAFAAVLQTRAADPSLAERLRLAGERLRVREQLQALQPDLAANAKPALGAATPAAVFSARDPGIAAGELKSELGVLLRQATEEENARTALDENLSRLTQRQSELSAQLQNEKARSVKKWRLPKEHAANKDPFFVIIRYGQVYPRFVMRESRSELNDAMIQFDALGDGIAAKPRAGQGLNPRTDALALEQLFRAIPRQRYYVAFVVYQDSFGVFDPLKDFVTQFDLEYGWDWFRDDQPLVFTSKGQAAAPPQ